MATSAAVSKRTLPTAALAVGALVLAASMAALLYLNSPAPGPAKGTASAEAKAYLANLELSDVAMQASENFMQQQVVEVQGKIGNKGLRELASIDVYCLFYGVDGREIHRERLAIVGAPGTRGSLKPGDVRPFRLPFDSLPTGWNQAMPKLVIAQITFGN